MVIEILAEKFDTGEQKTFYYSNLTAKISEEPFAEDIETPGFSNKKGDIKRVKIQLGMACNYSCSYCSQAMHAGALKPQTKDLSGFIARLKKYAPAPKKFELWGGEPLLYFKTIKKLVPLLRENFDGFELGMVSNGSLLTDEIVDFIIENDISMAISHDGPGQHQRGAEIIDEKRPQLERLMDALLPRGRFSFNPVLTAANYKRSEIVAFFREKFPNHKMGFGEMMYIDAYHEEGEELLDITPAQHTEMRRFNWLEIRANAVQSSEVFALQNYISEHGKHHPVVGQPCGMDREETIAVDLDGNLMTCQNVSAASVSDNGQTHKIGTLDSYDVSFAGSQHWKDRKQCSSCLLLKTCKGGCMFLHDDKFDKTCDMMFTGHLPMFAVAFELETGFVPVWSNTPIRKNIWEHETVFKKKKIIPIKAA